MLGEFNLNINNLINISIEGLKTIKEERFYYTERGYQGRLYCSLQSKLDSLEVPERAIIEMEYQKSSRHGMTQRPDIVIHIPAEFNDLEVIEGNFVVFALKKKANKEKAKEDFDKLDEMFESLRYQYGFFINISSQKHFLEYYDGQYKDKIHSFAVNLIENSIFIKHAYWKNGEFFTKEYNDNQDDFV